MGSELCTLEAGSARSKPPAMREVNFIMEGHEHVEWPAEGLSSTGAPGQPALRLPLTHESASTPNLLQTALHLPPC